MEIKTWIIVSKDRKLIAGGRGRSRELLLTTDIKRGLMTYSSKKMAESAFKVSFFYQPWKNVTGKDYTKKDLEAIEITFNI